MKRKLLCFVLVVIMLSSNMVVFADTTANPKAESNLNINNPNKDKNWFDDYRNVYQPPSSLPERASSAIGFRSLSDSSYYEYKQKLGSLNAQVSGYYANSFEEIFAPGSAINFQNLMTEVAPPERVSTGVDVFDNYKPDEYEGLSEEELKWLINNQIISRDPATMTFGLESINLGPVSTLYVKGGERPLYKTDFLMALHKATYGVIESRPLVFDLNAYRKAEKVTWLKLRDSYGNLTGYQMQVGAFTDQLVDSQSNGGIKDTYEILDRQEFKVRLENDTHYSMVTFPDHDKLMVTSPNVFELYLKSYLDKGIINSKNLDPTYESKNSIIDGSTMKTLLDSYGKIDNSKNQSYPSWAYELGPSEDGLSHVYFNPVISGGEVWGKRYNISGDSIVLTGQNSYFKDEGMTTMEALKLIEIIMRQTEGDMSATEAQLVSYKYGANVIDKFSGNDKNTVAYLTAKGILNFEDFNEYRFMYTPLTEEFGLMLLYRVANPNARKNFSQIQLTDSDSFWIGKGFGSYNMNVTVPNAAALEVYRDEQGDITMNPRITSTAPQEDKVHMSTNDPVDTKAVTVGPVVQLNPNTAQTASARMAELTGIAMTSGTFGENEPEAKSLAYMMGNMDLDSLTASHTINRMSLTNTGVEIYHNESDEITFDYSANFDYSKEEKPQVAFLAAYSMGSPFAAPTQATAQSDAGVRSITVEKLIDNPWGYLYNQKPLMDGTVPALKSERIAQASGSDPKKMIVTPSAQKDSALTNIYYDSVSDRYTVVFKVSTSDVQSALQLVDSNMEFSTTVNEKQPVQVVSKIMSSGKEVILINKQAFPLIDSELIIVSDKILLNRRTGAKAILLTDQNVALVGNEIIEASEDTLMVVANDGQTYYNLEIIRSLLSNTFLSEIGACDFISSQGIQPEKILPVYSTTGDKLASALVGTYKITETVGESDNGQVEVVENLRSFINMSQLTSGNNLLTKEVTRKTRDGIEFQFRVIIEWKLYLPPTDANYPVDWVDASKNPTIKDINNFFYTRPNNIPELADWWDNNIAVSNAMANVMYGTSGVTYINCGYLIPNLSVLYYVDKPTQENDLAVINLSNVQPIIGEWLQLVGNEIPLADPNWVMKFVGNNEIYNKIISTNNTTVTQHTSYVKRETYEGKGITAVGEGHYRITANEGSKYYPEKDIPCNWYPAWVHTYYNNGGLDGYNSSTAANTSLWRTYALNRTFQMYDCKERRSEGNLFGAGTPESSGWMILHTGALYKKALGSEYDVQRGGVVATTRIQTQDLNAYKGEVINYQGHKYYLSRIQEQYLELVALDQHFLVQFTDTGKEIGVSAPSSSNDPNGMLEGLELFGSPGNLLSGTNANLYDAGRAGYEAMRRIFIGDSSSSEYVKKRDTVAPYSTLGNQMNELRDYPVSGEVIVIQDSYGALTAKRFQTTTRNGVIVPNNSTYSAEQRKGMAAWYNPVIQLSLLGWTIEKVAGSDELVLVSKRSIPALLYDGFYPSALSRTVVDTLISKSVTGDKVSELPSGSILLIGDHYFYKEVDGSYTSTAIPINPSKDLPNLSSGNFSQQDLNGIAIKTLNLPVDVNGRVSTVASYVNNVKLGPEVGNDKFSYSNTLIASSLTKQVAMKATKGLQTKAYMAGSSISSIVLNLTLDEGLLAMPIEKDSKTFMLLFTSTEDGKEALIDSVYFKDDKKTSLITTTRLDAFIAEYKALPNQDEIRADFNKEDREMVLRDVKWWIQCLLCMVIGYLLMMCVLVWFGLKIGTVNVLANRWKYPTNRRKGFDIIKILTFGVMDIDTEISGGKLLISMLMLCVLFTIVTLV